MNFHEQKQQSVSLTAAWHDTFDKRSRVLCALLTSLALSAPRSWHALLAGAAVPFVLLCAGGVKPLARTLLKLNLASVFVCVLLPLTYPGERVWGIFSPDGLAAALLITVKLNLISVVTLRLLGSMGMELGGVLKSLGFPVKLSVLTILTTRYIFLLTGRAAAMTRAVRLRAPGLRGRRLWNAFACMLGTTLIHSADRADRAMLAVRCRGGMDGFFQPLPARWRSRDTLLCVFSALNTCLIISASLIW